MHNHKCLDHFCDSLWVWEKPAYSIDDVKRFHEEGFSSSPVIRIREPEFPFEGDCAILFVSECIEKRCEPFPNVYLQRAKEGPGAKEQIVSLLKSLKKSSKKMVGILEMNGICCTTAVLPEYWKIFKNFFLVITLDT